jgi:hypothetical protein
VAVDPDDTGQLVRGAAGGDEVAWRGLVDSIPTWDRLIEDFNAEVGARRAS